jgi:hypothetical protein
MCSACGGDYENPDMTNEPETLKQMHERIQAEQRSAYAAKANRENVKLLIAAMTLEANEEMP